MAFSAVCAVLFLSQAAATDVKIDWKTLTDFTATYEVHAKHVNDLLRQMKHVQSLPIAETSESGTIQADVVGEKLRIHGHGSATLGSGLPGQMGPMLAGNNVEASAELAFDGVAGWVAVRAKASVQPIGGGVEYCVTVNVPKGMLPPPQMMEMLLKQKEAMVDARMAMLPPHKEVEIDGTSVALWDLAAGPPPAPHAYVGLRHDGSPFGAGIVAPSNGQWMPYIKFPTWKQGAGEIAEFECAPSASTSASELMNDPQAAHMLAVFDELVASLHDTQSMSMVLASFPHSPSLLFQGAAAMELNAAKQTAAQGAPALSFVSVAAVAAFAGGVGASLVLAALKMSNKLSTDARREALLSSVA